MLGAVQTWLTQRVVGEQVLEGGKERSTQFCTQAGSAGGAEGAGTTLILPEVSPGVTECPKALIVCAWIYP